MVGVLVPSLDVIDRMAAAFEQEVLDTRTNTGPREREILAAACFTCARLRIAQNQCDAGDAMFLSFEEYAELTDELARDLQSLGWDIDGTDLHGNALVFGRIVLDRTLSEAVMH